METPAPSQKWNTLLAFAIIYLVWGSTFLAIRVGVREVPPFLLAAIRFLVAGLAVRLDDRARRTVAHRAPVDRSLPTGFHDFRSGLRIAVLGGAARAFGHCGRHAGHHSGIY